MEEDYETAVRQFYCRPPSPTPSHKSAAAEPSKPGLQNGAAAQSIAPPLPSKSASTSSTCHRGRRKRDASAQVIGGPGDASAQVIGGPGDASAQVIWGLGDASASAHATEGLSDASAPAHATEGLGDASASAQEQLVFVLASEPRDEGFEEGAPPDSVSEGSPGSASASEGPSGHVPEPDSRPAGTTPDSRAPTDPKPDSGPDCPEL
ncbi:hypothetical protein CRENBAI_009480 [Crenichthys baileyi]|uniref:Uncharacterized protein n=1 Tax=Crenichthys baileyi TaxID=28760 RepID=A0AAV9R9A9_9TELE